jgi:hypothetical protein
MTTTMTRRRLALLGALCAAALRPDPAAAQIPSVLQPGRLFALQGELTTFGELYGISGREPRRPGSTGRLLFRPTMQLTRHVKLALDLQLTTEGSVGGAGAGSPTLGAGRQRLNQLGVSPEWSWGRLHLGDFTDSYTPLTFSGVRVRGAGTVVNPGLLRFGVFGGAAQTAVLGGATSTTYARDIVGGRIGVGREEGSYLDLIFVRATDDAASLPPPDDTAFVDPRQNDPTVDPDTLPVGTLINPLSVTPQENVVVGAAGRLTLFDRALELRGELSGAAYSRDVRASALDNEALLDEIPGVLRGLFTPRISSTFGAAYVAEADVRVRGFTGSAALREIAPGYAALGVASLLNDQRAWELGGTQRFGRRVSLRLEAGSQRDNLLGQKSATTNRDRYGGVVTVRPTTRWTAALRVHFVGMHNDVPAGSADWIAYDNWIVATNHTVSLGRDRLLRSVGFAYTYRLAGDDNPARQASSLRAHSANVRVVVAPSRALSVTPSIGLVRSWPASASGWRLRETYGLAAQLRTLDGKWTTSASLGSSQEGTVGVLQGRITSRYALTPADQLTLSIRGSSYSNARNPFGAPGDFQELTVNLQMTHRFGNGP